MKRTVESRLFPEYELLHFTHRQSALFWNIVGELVQPDFVVMDFGAGRGRQTMIGNKQLQFLANLRGRCKMLVGVDPDPAVFENPSVDEAHCVAVGEPLPFPDNAFDLIYSYAVFEHVANPEFTVSELRRVLKPGGWLCAWTPNKWGYVGISARAVPNRLHAKVVGLAFKGGRKSEDVFPTLYRMNTLARIRTLFEGFEHHSFTHNGEPSYNFGSTLIARFWLLYMAVLPKILAQSIFVVERKREFANHVGT